MFWELQLQDHGYNGKTDSKGSCWWLESGQLRVVRALILLAEITLLSTLPLHIVHTRFDQGYNYRVPALGLFEGDREVPSRVHASRRQGYGWENGPLELLWGRVAIHEWLWWRLVVSLQRVLAGTNAVEEQISNWLDSRGDTNWSEAHWLYAL